MNVTADKTKRQRTKIKKFWSGIARKYAKDPVRDPAAYEHTLERTLVHITGLNTVLELGCGTGSTAFRLAEHTGQYVASDISEEMIVIAKEKSATQGRENLSFVVAGHDEPDMWGVEKVNAIMAFNLMHLVPDTERMIANVHAALDENGIFISKSACLSHANIFIKVMIKLMQCVGKAPPVRFFTVEQLEDMISSAGFDILETGTFPKSPPARFIVARKKV